MGSVDKHALAKIVTAAKPTDIAVSHAHLIGGMSGKEALDSLKTFVARKGNYTVIIIRG